MEELSDYPEAFRDDEIYPWQREAEPVVWRWGSDMGRLLTEISSKELVRKRRWLERDPEAFADLIAAIDEILTARAGE